MSRRHRVSPEQIARARDVPLLEYLRQHGYPLKKDGRYYRLEEHDSLVIDPDRNRWHWNSQGIHNANTVDFLVEYERMALPDAVVTLTGEAVAAPLPRPPSKPVELSLQLPARFENDYRVLAYLTKTRGLPARLITPLLREGLLYESTPGHNAVFVRLDDAGNPAGYFERGTLTAGKPYKHDPGGSAKRWTFLLPGADTRRLYVCEAAIDVLSVETLRTGAGAPARQYPILSLAGNSTVALEQYLAVSPQPEELYVCTDNDEGGETAFAAVIALTGQTCRVYRCAPPTGCKDWNEACTQGIPCDNAAVKRLL